MEADKIRQKFLDFFKNLEDHPHQVVPSSSLVPTDASVLLTTAGMQQFKPYFLGEKSSWGPNVASVQKCFRTSDIDEVGDESHLTFFEMLGNFSFGGYGKREAIRYGHDFLTKELGLKIDYVSVFGGEGDLPADEEAEKIWREVDSKLEIKRFGRADNFWGPTGESGPCGPTTEIYVNGIEIWNIVFNEFYSSSGKLEPLDQLGIDTGMGLERLAMVVQGKQNIFETDLFSPQFKFVLADHARAIAFLVADSIRPSNKGAGYILRRLLRRLLAQTSLEEINKAIGWVVENYQVTYPELNKNLALEVVEKENQAFAASLALGLKELEKLGQVDAVAAFRLYETHGLPFEVIRDRFPTLRREDFDREFEKHQEVSRAGAAGQFAGGLADHEPATIKLHTAHHLLLAALKRVLGENVKQRGSNINQDRLRLDFSFDRKLTAEEKKQVEDLVNEKIKENLAVTQREMPRAEAEQLGAEMEFGAKYGETVSVYFIEDEKGEIFSKEFCGGPHVAQTGELGHFKILKEEATAAGVRRIKARFE